MAISSYDLNFLERVKNAGQHDEKYQQMKETLKQDGEDEEYHLTEDRLIRFKNRIYVPNTDDLKRLIMREYHVKPYSGHSGYQKTVTAIKNFYYWPNLKREVGHFAAKCIKCH